MKTPAFDALILGMCGFFFGHGFSGGLFTSVFSLIRTGGGLRIVHGDCFFGILISWLLGNFGLDRFLFCGPFLSGFCHCLGH